MPNVRDRAFVTFAQTSWTKAQFSDVLQKLGICRAVIVEEPHADGGRHVHVAASGKIQSNNFARRLHDQCAEGQSINILYAHPPKAKQTRGSIWPYELMVKYITNPSKEKDCDSEPLCIGGDNPGDVIEAHKASKAAYTEVCETLRELKENRAPVEEVIETLMPLITKDNSHQYRMYMDYYDHLQRKKPILTEAGELPRPWQKIAAAFAATPIEKGSTCDRGLWINLPSGVGKSWLQCYLYDNHSVFIPGIRPHGDYDLISFRAYAGEEIILINDLSASVFESSTGETVVKWKRNVLNLLKCICDNVPLAIEFAGKHTELHFKAKVIVSSNFPLPTGATAEEREAFARRYVVLDDENQIEPTEEEENVPPRGIYRQSFQKVLLPTIFN